ncbi:MAG TPA: CBS domain-containing protein [Actinomycetota bacterium]|nr:CBS domain-containing protein [Actinomycetota bacterium]
MRAKDVMTTPVITVSAGTPVKQVASVLVSNRISAVPVVDEHEDLIGIVSEGDLVPLETTPDPRSLILPIPQERGALPEIAADVMTRDVITVDELADASLVARLMLERRVKSIPVVDGKRVVGIVARRDLLKVLARSDKEILAELGRLLEEEIELGGRFRPEVSGGIVTLAGPRQEAGRRRAELLARSVPGVIDVRFAETP